MKFRKGQVAWNKGLEGYMKGHPPYMIAKGKDNPFFGKKHTEETKLKMREKKLGKYHFQSKETKIKIGLSNRGKKSVSGEKHWNWKGGISSLNDRLRCQSKWRVWREMVFLRDNFTCQNPNCYFCGNKIGVMLHPHHIKSKVLYPELMFSINNGITYCAEFHLKSKLHKNIMQKEA